MLRELKNIKQIEGEPRRRWFADEELDLILWYNSDKRLDGFEICYDKLAGSKSITWKTIQTVEGLSKSILVSNSFHDRERIRNMLADRSDNLEHHLRKFILDRLEANGGGV